MEEVTVSIKRLIQSKASSLKSYDDANPDVGMGYPYSYFEDLAVKQLKAEGIIPQDYNGE